MTFDEPIQATLSDKFTRISARISISATREYRKQHRRPFTKDKTGGLLQILDFEIVATHLGPRSDRLTLLVNRFKSLGSDGSGAFSVPRPIESPDKGCFALLDKLIGIRAQEKASSSQEPSTRESSVAASSIHSQTAFAANGYEVSPDSQAVLATQVPVALEIHNGCGRSATAQGSNNQRTIDLAKTFDSLTDHAEESEVPAVGAAQAVGCGLASSTKSGTKISDTHADLLCSLNRKVQEKPMTTTSMAEDDTTKKAIPTKDTTVDMQHEIRRTTASHITDISMQNDVVNQSKSHLSSAQEPTMAPPLGKICVAARNGVSDINVAKDGPIPSKALQGSSKKRKLSDRISSRDVRIPRDQEILLSRPDSWIPAEPGQREPRVNVPISLLQAFNRDAESRLKDLKGTPEESTGREASTRIGSMLDTPISHSESDIDSEQWPPSPELDQLPPDSSPPVVSQSNNQNGVLESKISPKLGPSLEILQAKNAALDLSDKSDSCERSERDDKIETTKATTREALSFSSSANASTQLVEEEALQDPTQQITTGANGSQVPLTDEIHSKVRPKREHLSVRKESSSENFPSAASTADSDIEMLVPMPLQKIPDPQLEVDVLGSFSSTATQSKHPFMQVKRTPYVDGHDHGAPKSPLTNGWSSVCEENTDLHDGKFNKENAGISSNSPIFDSKAQSQSSSPNVVSNSEEDPDKISMQRCPIKDGSTSEKIFTSAVVGSSRKRQFEYKAADRYFIHDSVRRINLFSDCLAPASITLEQGAQIMLIKTVDEDLTHGSLGEVVAFMDTETFTRHDGGQTGIQGFPSVGNQKWPVLRFEMAGGKSRHLLCRLEQWDIRSRNGVTEASRRQVPLVRKNDSSSHVKDLLGLSDHVLGDGKTRKPLHEHLPGKRLLQRDEDSTDGSPISKRTKRKPTFFYSNLSRRRERVSGPLALDISDINDSSPDPAASARQYRKLYFAAKRSCESSTAGKSPFSPPKSDIISLSIAAERRNDGIAEVATRITTDSVKNGENGVAMSGTSAALASKTAESYDANFIEHTRQRLPNEMAVGYPAIGMPSCQDPSHMSYLVEPNKASLTDRRSPFEVRATQSGQANTSFGTTAETVESLPLSVRSTQNDTILGQATTHANMEDRPVPRPLEGGKARRATSPRSAFEEFKGTYSDYSGDVKHFLTLCKKIEKLWRLDRLHKSIWDDFLIRNKIEYADHVRQSMEDGNDPMPYEKFYNDEIDEPRYRRRVLTPLNLEAIIHDGGPRPVLSCETSVASTPVPASFSSMIPGWMSKAVTSSQSPVKHTPTIDLTDDDPERVSHASKGADGQPKTQASPQRRTPWLLDRETTTSSTYEAGRRSSKCARQPSRQASQEFSSSDLKAKSKNLRLNATSNMTVEAPSRTISANARLKGRHQASPLIWWQDEDAPFKTFVRSYLAIRPGNGNAFAKPEDIAQGKRQYKSQIRNLRDLDVSGWKVDPMQQA